MTIIATQVDNLRTQLAHIEHTTTNRCQDFEDAVDEFQSKVSKHLFDIMPCIPVHLAIL